jgi:hydroxymethylpyrimidine/phosphomethylpyrimidine kinase
VIPIALTIAGSDPSGGAGIQADLKTFHQFGVYGQAVITLLTVQNTLSVSKVHTLESELIREQIEAVLADVPPAAVKTGALGSELIINMLGKLDLPRLVVDPVMISKHGMPLMTEEARHALAMRVLPRALLVTPNLHEAAALAGFEITSLDDMREAARRIASLGPVSVLIKGGHLPCDAIDLLLYEGQYSEYSTPRIDTPHTHGTGCSYSAAITALLARGESIPTAVARAKIWITEAIRTNPGLGGGSGPVNHFART